MCGIAGIYYPRQIKLRTRLKHRGIVDAMMLSNAERGRDATGVFNITRDGKHYLAKAPLPVEEFIQTPQYAQAFSREDTFGVVGHTRMSTTGTPKQNQNNHPLYCGKVIGVHNGTILHPRVYAALHELTLRTDVDSEVIFRMIDKFYEPGRGLEKLNPYFAGMRGTMVAIWVHKTEPGVLNVVRSGRPLTIVRHKRTRTVLFASEARYIQTALIEDGQNLSMWDDISVTNNSMAQFFFDDGDVFWTRSQLRFGGAVHAGRRLVL